MYKINLYGVSEIKQNDNGNTIGINLPLTSDNGMFELNLEKIGNKAILRIKNKDNNEVYWNSKDYNPDLYNNSGSLGLPPIVNSSDTIVLLLQEDGNLALRSAQNITLGCFASSVKSKYNTHKPWVGGVDKKPYSLKLTDKGKLEIKDKNGVVTWSTTYMWESLETPFSADLIPASDTASTYPYKFPVNYLFGIGNIGNSIIKDYYDKFYKGKDVPVDFSPFKIVPAVYLKNIGKANSLYNIENLNGAMLVRDSNFFVFRTQLTFLETDPYLPLGDPGHMENVWDYDHLFCLVKNDPKYCKPLFNSNNDYRCISDGWNCRGDEDFTVAIPSSMNKDPYVALGGVVGMYKNCGILRVAGNNNFYSAAVNPDYLYKTNIIPTQVNSPWYIGFDNGSRCGAKHFFWYTSPFLTWIVASNNFGNNLDEIAGTYNKFYDLLPYNVALSICAGDFSPTVGGEKVSLSSESCNSIALTHCSADSGNLPSNQCINYYKKLSKTENSYNYDDEFIKFCVDQGKYRDPAYDKLCACFLPTQVYEEYINAIVDGLPDEQKDQVRSALTQPPPCNYPACAIDSIESVPRWNFSRGDSCTNNAIQVCLNKTEIKNEGTLNGNVSTDTMINCLQTVTPEDIASLPPLERRTKKSSNTLWIVLGIVFVVLIILYFTVFKK